MLGFRGFKLQRPGAVSRFPGFAEEKKVRKEGDKEQITVALLSQYGFRAPFQCSSQKRPPNTIIRTIHCE